MGRDALKKYYNDSDHDHVWTAVGSLKLEKLGYRYVCNLCKQLR